MRFQFRELLVAAGAAGQGIRYEADLMTSCDLLPGEIADVTKKPPDRSPQNMDYSQRLRSGCVLSDSQVTGGRLRHLRGAFLVREAPALQRGQSVARLPRDPARPNIRNRLVNFG